MCNAFIRLEPAESKTLSVTQVIPDIIPLGTYTAKIGVKSIRGEILKIVPVSVPLQNCP